MLLFVCGFKWMLYNMVGMVGDLCGLVNWLVLIWCWCWSLFFVIGDWSFGFKWCGMLILIWWWFCLFVVIWRLFDLNGIRLNELFLDGCKVEFIGWVMCIYLIMFFFSWNMCWLVFLCCWRVLVCLIVFCLFVWLLLVRMIWFKVIFFDC